MLEISRCMLPLLLLFPIVFSSSFADETKPKATLSESQQTAVSAVESAAGDIAAVNRAIWEFAEVGLEEKKSSALLVEKLRKAGFEVQTGVAHMPTAFVATYGSGSPVIGILAEYDALPGLSQKGVPYREAMTDGGNGHGCGHSGLGAGAVGGALAAKAAMEKHGLKGTIKVFGTPAEETLIGKVYMLLDGQFDDLDICLHWHPGSRNEAWAGSSKAAVSAKFTFHGTAAHASGSPHSGRSALDAVELMNVGVNFMREHVKEDARLHYVITNGGGAPNVVPATATVWYYVRADKHEDLEKYFAWVNDVAKGAALMTRTKLDVQIETDCHEIIPNTPLAELLSQTLDATGAPRFTQDEHAYARRLQEPLAEEFKTTFDRALDERVHPLSIANQTSKGSTDVGDISWYVPTGGFRTACFAAESPGHSWQNVASIGSTIGDKGTVYAAKVMAAAAVELLENAERVAEAKADFTRRMKDRKYTSLVPKGQKAPVRIR